MVDMALTHAPNGVVEFDEDHKAVMASNLMVVLGLIRGSALLATPVSFAAVAAKPMAPRKQYPLRVAQRVWSG